MVSKWEKDSQDLIAEREQDLELAAIFGKMLLEKNRELSDKIDYLEQQLIITNDQVNQLRQRISVKSKLLNIYSQDMEDIEMKYDSLVKMQQSSDICQMSLSRKSKLLEDSNQQLQLETFRLASLISDKEKNEDKTGKDFLEKLAQMSDKVEILVADLTVKTRENSNKEKTILSLLSKVEKLQKENTDLCSEKINNQKKIQKLESSLQELKMEVIKWKDQYDELLHFMEGIQGQFTSFQSWYKPKLPIMENVSLALELEEFNHTKADFPDLHECVCDDQIANKYCYRGTPDGEFTNEYIPESTHSVEKGKTNECCLFDSANENNSKKENTEELGHLKQYLQLNSSNSVGQSEKWHSCKTEMTVKCNTVNSHVQSNMGNCYPKLLSKLQMIKQIEGSAVLKHWQQLAVQQKGFGFSSDLCTVQDKEVYTYVD